MAAPCPAEQPEVERWLPVPGWEGYYSVSDFGHIRSETRTVRHAHSGMIRRQGCPIALHWAGGKHGRGSLVVTLQNQGKRHVKVSHLVMLAFVGPLPAGMEVLHWDDNPENNRLSNLRYGTHSDNMKDRRRNGNDHRANQTHCLDNIPDDLLGGPPPPAEIRLAGKTLTTLEDPPAGGEDVVLLVRLKVRAAGVDFNDDGNEEVPYRSMKLVSCWKPGSKEPAPIKSKAELEAEMTAEAAQNQPPLYDDETGEPYDPQTDPEIDRPGFSDSDGAA